MVVDQPTAFWNLLLVYSPIIFLLLTMLIIDINTTGKSMALIICDQIVILMSGALGIRIMITAIAIINVNKA